MTMGKESRQSILSSAIASFYKQQAGHSRSSVLVFYKPIHPEALETGSSASESVSLGTIIDTVVELGLEPASFSA